MSRLTHAEAEELVVDRLDGFAENEGASFEATIIGADIGETWDAVDAFLATLGRPIDRSSIEVTPDRLDDMDVACVTIFIKTREA